MRLKNKKLTDIKADVKNANMHSEHGMELLGTSIEQNKFGRSILISGDDVIIAGNGTATKAGELGVQNVKIIETDGNELIAIKRTDIKSNTPEFFKMALADNIVSQKNIVMDADVVEEIASEFAEVIPWAEYIVNANGSGGADDPQVDLSKFSQWADSYANGAIRQINLFFTIKDHAKVLQQLIEIGEHYGISNDNTAIVETLIKHWYATIGTEKKQSKSE